MPRRFFHQLSIKSPIDNELVVELKHAICRTQLMANVEQKLLIKPTSKYLPNNFAIKSSGAFPDGTCAIALRVEYPVKVIQVENIICAPAGCFGNGFN
jgi:hypothetical protein